jgi:hypothetical protein
MRELIPTVVVPLIVVVLGGLLSLTANRRASRLRAVEVVWLIASIVCVSAAITLVIIWIRAPRIG